jgi:hypothetical protein
MSLPKVKGATPAIDNDGISGDHKPHEHKTLHDGTKNFWRTGENVDVRIIEHIDASCIEVIAFSVDKHEEADRIYLDAKRVFKKVDDNEIEEKMTAKREELSRQRKRVPNDEIKAGLLREAVVQYVMNRMNVTTTTIPKKERGVHSHTNSNESNTDTSSGGETTNETFPSVADTENTGTNGENTTTAGTIAEEPADHGDTDKEESDSINSARKEEGFTEGDSLEAKLEAAKKEATKVVKPEVCDPRFAIEMTPLTGDQINQSTGLLAVTLSQEPLGIEHITILRQRKKASTKEFNTALKKLRQDHHKLTGAMSNAQRAAGLAVSSVEGFQGMLSRATFDPTKMTIAEFRWKKACRRVILQNAVAAVTRRLERYTMGDAPTQASENQEGIKAQIQQRRRLKPSASATRLPSLGEDSRASAKSTNSRRRIARGSREPRPLDDFSQELSSAIKEHADSKLEGQRSNRGSRTSFTSPLPTVKD